MPPASSSAVFGRASDVHRHPLKADQRSMPNPPAVAQPDLIPLQSAIKIVVQSTAFVVRYRSLGSPYGRDHARTRQTSILHGEMQDPPVFVLSKEDQ